MTKPKDGWTIMPKGTTTKELMDKKPNKTTIKAFKEIEAMIKDKETQELPKEPNTKTRREDKEPFNPLKRTIPEPSEEDLKLLEDITSEPEFEDDIIDNEPSNYPLAIENPDYIKPYSSRIPRGRPANYTPEYHCDLMTKLALLGAGNEEIASVFHISPTALYEWYEKYPELVRAKEAGGLPADASIARSLYLRGHGYEVIEEKAMAVGGVIEKVKVKKHIPADVGAAAKWLNNRRGQGAAERNKAGKPVVWAERKEVEHTLGKTFDNLSDEELEKLAKSGTLEILGDE